MTFLDPVKNFLNKTDSKTFQYYIIGYGAACGLLFIAMIFYYYSSINALQKKIKNVNASREEVLALLEKSALVQQQRAMVEEILAKEPDFKIVGAFLKILTSPDINLKDKEVGEEISTTDLEENYRKSELTAKFEGMTMQDLTKLLQKIEENQRIATERLEIIKKKPTQKTVEVSLTISTLLPKIENTST